MKKEKKKSMVTGYIKYWRTQITVCLFYLPQYNTSQYTSVVICYWAFSKMSEKFRPQTQKRHILFVRLVIAESDARHIRPVHLGLTWNKLQTGIFFHQYTQFCTHNTKRTVFKAGAWGKVLKFA